ncbi:MAG: alpha/beta hydrolase [Actinomycetota bacterium]
MNVDFVDHVRVQLAVHELRGGEGRPLLLLHGLGERTPSELPSWVADDWSGPVLGLDFTGHGLSTIPVGGGYTCEVLMADADAVVAEVGAVTLLGRGLGAYVGLLLAGARPAEVRGAVLLDGPGLTGGGSGPVVNPIAEVGPGPHRAPDPYALVELSRDLRPSDYAAQFARQACALGEVEFPITVAAGLRPPWLRAVVEEHGVVTGTVPEALRRYDQLP